MAHEMYGINELLKQYPLVEKAFQRTESWLETAMFVTGGERAVIETPKRIIETVINTIDGTDSEKQALIVGVMYAMSPIASAVDFESEYGAEAKEVMDSLFAYDKTSVAPMHVARASVVVQICLLTNMMASVNAEAPGAFFPKEMVQAAKGHIHDNDMVLLPNLNAPRLEALFQKTTQKYIDMLEGKPPSPPKFDRSKPGKFTF